MKVCGSNLAKCYGQTINWIIFLPGTLEIWKVGRLSGFNTERILHTGYIVKTWLGLNSAPVPAGHQTCPMDIH